MKVLRATGANVALIPDRGKRDEEGRAISEGGSYLGREVDYPTGVVVSIGEEAKRLLPELREGDKVVYQRMLQSVMDLDGVGLEVVSVAAACPKCKERLHKGGIIGILDEKVAASEEAA